MFLGNGPIKMLYPGRVTGKNDTGIGSIGRIDHPEFRGNTTIAMHPHVNDEILSYFRTGKAEHSDSEGFSKLVGQNTLMLMKAGKSFFHEEKIMGADEPFEGLQIFIRPGRKDLPPAVIFNDLETIHSENEWRLLASPGADTVFQFSSQTWLYDRKLLNNSTAVLPTLAAANLTCLLYVFKGSVTVNDNIPLNKKESLLINNEAITINTTQHEAELVLFVTDENAEVYDGGMYSGNKM